MYNPFRLQWMNRTSRWPSGEANRQPTDTDMCQPTDLSFWNFKLKSLNYY